MAHRRGRRVRLEHGARVVGRASAALVARAASRFTFGRPGGLALVALLLLGASAVPFLAGSAGGAPSALAAMPAGQLTGAALASAPAASPAVVAIPASVVSAALGSVTGSSGIDPVDLIVKGIVVGVLLYLTLRVLRRVQAGPANGSRRLEILETRSLGPKASLYLVAVGERRLVVGLSPGGIVSIADIDPAELAAPAGARDRAPFGAHDRAAPAGAYDGAALVTGSEAPAVDRGTAVLGLVRTGWAGAKELLSARPAVIPDARSQATRRGITR